MEGQEFTTEGKENISLSDFVELEKSFDKEYLTVANLLLYSGNTRTNNLDRIWSKYDSDEQKKYKSDYKSGSLPYIKPNTTIIVPRSVMELESLSMYGKNQFYEHKDFSAFFSDNLETLQKSDGFVQHQKLEFKGGVTATLRNENIRVYVVRKDSIGYVIEDLTPQIINCQTSKNMNGGTFNLTISDRPKETSDARGYQTVTLDSVSQTESFLGSNGYYASVLSNNDLVFIRYEQLQLEKENYKGSNLQSSDLAAYSTEGGDILRTWDMIGFITNTVATYNASPAERTLNINGQDLTKLLTEDGSYFIPLRFIEGSNKRFFYGGDAEDKWFKRNVISGDYQYYFAYKTRSIRETIGFIVNHLSNIGLVDDRVFDGYGERRSKIYDFSPDASEYRGTKEVKGIWNIVKFFIDDASEERRVADDSFTNPEGTLMDFFKRVCQMPFVEFFGDTYLDTFDFVVRKPPFDKAAIQSIVNKGQYITIQDSDLYSHNLYFDERNFSWYQIQPQNGLFADDGYTSLTYLPIVYFPQYAEVFGNKKLVVPNNYISKDALDGNKGTGNRNLFVRKMLNDYIYMIESNIYLPFTRKGNVTLNGDRRIKVGTFVKLNKTNELFYVTGVSQSGSYGRRIDRTTTIQVERGMVFDYVNGVGATRSKTAGGEVTGYLRGEVEVAYSSINYFNILNASLIRDSLIYNAEKGGVKSVEKESATFGLNESIFKFFLNRNHVKNTIEDVRNSKGLNLDGSLITDY